MEETTVAALIVESSFSQGFNLIAAIPLTILLLFLLSLGSYSVRRKRK